VVGAAFWGIIGSLVKDVINPPLGLLLGGVDFTNLIVMLKGEGAYPVSNLPAAAFCAGRFSKASSNGE
jgi:large conductance mechanosensitive channel